MSVRGTSAKRSAVSAPAPLANAAGSAATRRRPLACFAVAAAVLAAHLASFPLDRPIVTDIRFSVYFASRAASGAVPYRDFFDNRTPLSTYLGALLHLIATGVGADPLIAMRIGCLAVAGLAGLVLFAVQRRLAAGDCVAGIAGLLPYVGFTVLAVLPSVGPFPKLLMALLAPLAALLAFHERWALAGAAAALAALDWQIGVLAAAGVVLAAVATPHERRFAWLRAAAGGAAVALAFLGVLAAAGALDDALRQIVLSAASRGASSMRESPNGRLEQILQVARIACPGQTWLLALGAAGMLALPLLWWRERRGALSRLACVLAVHHYGVVAFSVLDFQRFGDLFILLQSLAFFAGIALALPVRLTRGALPSPRSAKPNGAPLPALASLDRARRVVSVAAVAILAVAVRPSVLHPDVHLPTHATRADVTLAGQRAVARELATRFAGRRVAVIGPSELLFLEGSASALPFIYWNAATWAFYRAVADEEPRDALLRILRDSRPDAIVYPEERLGHDERLDAEYAPLELVSPDGTYRLPLLVRR